MSFLYGINSPKDLKKLRIEDLPFLAQELRQAIIDVCAKNGGHLGGSLGAVDLIVALHYCFNMPEDKIVWDVGHQAYAHKALTGRKERLHTIRLTDGLSGFPKRDESPYDTYGTAHASTGISAALGIKAAKDLKGEKDFVVVVVGDGGLTGGMAYEGLNQCGHLKKNLIVILNDNGMSISKNVGAIAQFLTKRASSNTYIRARREIKHLLDLLSEYGVPLLNPIEKIRTSLKSLFSSGIFFESLGLRYLGPFDGHDIPTLVDIFKHIPTQPHSHPLLIHVITKKGKGYPVAEANPVTYHGVSPFDPETGKSLPVKAGPPSYTSIFANTLMKVAKENPKIIGITAAMPEGTGLDKFAAEFPNRYFDVGIAEQHAVLFAAGLATEGMKPAVAIYSTFLQRAYDPIIHDIALQKLPVHFFLDRAGFVGTDGATHHGVFDISYLRCIPNLIIMAPKDENELQHMVKTSFDFDQPTAVRYPRGAGFGIKLDEELKHLELGKAEIVYPESISHKHLPKADFAIFAVGAMVHPAIKAAQILSERGFSPIVVNARYIKPLDETLISDLARHVSSFFTVEENVLAGGFGSAIFEFLSKSDLEIPLYTLGIPDRFFDHATQSELRAACGLDPIGISQFVDQFFKKRISVRTRIEKPQKPLKIVDIITH